MYGIINSVNLSVAAMYDMQQSLSADLDTSSLEGAREEIAQATAALYEMNEALQNQPALNVPQTRPEPATQPASTPAGASFAWTSDNLEVFNTAGLERWEPYTTSTPYVRVFDVKH